MNNAWERSAGFALGKTGHAAGRGHGSGLRRTADGERRQRRCNLPHSGR